MSLVGVIGLVFIGLFVDTSAGREGFTYPGDVAIWRPVLRLTVHGYVAFTITALAACSHSASGGSTFFAPPPTVTS